MYMIDVQIIDYYTYYLPNFIMICWRPTLNKTTKQLIKH